MVIRYISLMFLFVIVGPSVLLSVGEEGSEIGVVLPVDNRDFVLQGVPDQQTDESEKAKSLVSEEKGGVCFLSYSLPS